jgi:tryptophanyl-tRNA synthetase
VAKETKITLPSFKQYREKDGQFYFKLVDSKGQVLLQSLGFASAKEAGQTIARLQSEGPSQPHHFVPMQMHGAALRIWH